jgi:hypothetical protein
VEFYGAQPPENSIRFFPERFRVEGKDYLVWAFLLKVKPAGI